MRCVCALAAICGLATFPGTTLEAGPNADATLPMHAIVLSESTPVPCEIPDPCDPGPPRVDIPDGSKVTVHVLLRNYDNVQGLQTAFDWGDWQLLGASWSCQGLQAVAVSPSNRGGPRDGTVATIFDCITGGTTAVIGSMEFVANGPGCLAQIESSWPRGTHVLDRANEVIRVPGGNRGSVCVGGGGIDACEPLVSGPGADGAVSVPLHAVVEASSETPTSPFDCDIPDPCDPGPPTVSVPPGATIAAYLMVRNYSDVAAIQTALDWGDWTFLGGSWTCLPHAMYVVQPGGRGGADDGSLVLAFDTITGGDTAVVGSMLFIANASGCLKLVAPWWPGDTHVVSGSFETDLIAFGHRGSICAGARGVDACDTGRKPPVCHPGGPYTAQEGDEIQFDGTASYGPSGVVRSYAWQFGDGSAGTGPTPTHVYEPGRYTVTLCVTDAHRTEACAATEVTIFAEPPLEPPEPQLPPRTPRFVGIEAANASGQVRLDWQITTETRDLSLTVLRREDDALDFILLPSSRHEIAAGDNGTYAFIDHNVVVGRRYAYVIEADAPGTADPIRSDTVWITVLPRSDAGSGLHRNQPNPFNPSTTIRFTVGEAGPIKLRIFDMSGRLVRALAEGEFETGTHAIEWKGRDDHGRALSSGVYVYRLEVSGSTYSRRMVLVR